MSPPLPPCPVQSYELESLLNSFDKDMADDTKDGEAQRLSAFRHIDGATPTVLKGIDPVYENKARVLNNAIQDIGMGWYQWQLFVVVGFGWASDNLWPIVTSLILKPVSLEFKASRPPLITLAQNIGLLFGAIFWGFGCDIFGRRLAFNLTIGITSVFGLLAATSPNFAAIGTFDALWSFGVGGNLPVGKFTKPYLLSEADICFFQIVLSSLNFYLELISIC